MDSKNLGSLNGTVGTALSFSGGEVGLPLRLIAAIHFEEKFVNFRDTRSIRAMILRVAGAGFP